MKRKLIALAVVAVALFVAQAVSAHTGKVAITCTDVTFSFSDFPSGSSKIDYEIKVDNVSNTGNFIIAGPTDSKKITLTLSGGTHTVYAKAFWQADGGGKIEATNTVTCAANPKCPSGYENGGTSDGVQLCLKTVTNTVTVPGPTVTVPGPTVTVTVPGPTKIVTKTKVKTKTVVKWKTKIVKKRICPIPPGGYPEPHLTG